MTVEELITQLSEYNPTATVLVETHQTPKMNAVSVLYERIDLHSFADEVTYIESVTIST